MSQLNALNYLQYRFFDSNDEIYSSQTLLGPSTNETEYLDQGYLEMAQAQNYATATALSHLGYKVISTNVGTLVFGTEPGSPAAKTLKVAQVITAVNGTPATTVCGLIEALHAYTPGTTVTLSVEDSSINDVGDFVAGPVVQTPIRWRRRRRAPSSRAAGRPSSSPWSSASSPRRSRNGTSRSTSRCTRRTSAAPRRGWP